MDYSEITLPDIFALKKQQELELAKETNPEDPTIDLEDVSNTY